MGAVSYISSREEHVTGDFEALNIRTIGMKNLDVQTVMNGRALPIEVSLYLLECMDVCIRFNVFLFICTSTSITMYISMYITLYIFTDKYWFKLP